MNWAQLVAELGGLGAIAPLVGGIFSSLFGALRDSQQLNRDWALQATKQEDKSNQEKLATLEHSELGRAVVWFIIIMAMMILAAGVWYPLIGYTGDYILSILQLYKFDQPVDAPTIGLVWYWPTEGSFLFWEWDKLKPFYVGRQEEDAEYIIAILPTFISIAANAVSFFLMNRVRKKTF